MLLRMGEFFSTILSLFLKNLVALQTEEGIIPLAQKSVEKLTGIPRETLAAADRPSGCTAATAVLDKKVLLILSLCTGLSVTIPVAEAPAIQTVRQLAEALYERVNL